MPEGTITEVKGKGEPFTTNYGDLVPWTVVVEGHGELEVNRKPSSPPPAVGALVEKIEDTEHGKKGKLAQQGSGSQNSGGKSYKADPAKQRAIAMQAAHNTALALIGHTQTLDGLDLMTVDGETKKAVLALVDRLSDHFYDRAMAAGEGKDS